ncbi:hypothetical protein DPMN_026986 [Dreissena polymorpha]|uniref:Uncharacterized protein n=1 Tax=Dreissena polymorpha TaxID=45954 RepID=A0A9D4LSN5_DREPO|nr:hypothetical protein DPMN_026986 [Dreissena polymorpha]
MLLGPLVNLILLQKRLHLKVKLQYLDVESKAKLEFDRVKALRRLEIAQANLEAMDEPTFDLNQPSRSRPDTDLLPIDFDRFTKEYI